jgi:hypothetical protein
VLRLAGERLRDRDDFVPTRGRLADDRPLQLGGGRGVGRRRERHRDRLGELRADRLQQRLGVGVVDVGEAVGPSRLVERTSNLPTASVARVSPLANDPVDVVVGDGGPITRGDIVPDQRDGGARASWPALTTAWWTVSFVIHPAA